MSKDLKELALEKMHELAYRKELNVFNVLSNADHEIRHSSFLAWLLDPEENHGFGSDFAVEFFYETFKEKGHKREEWEKRFNKENFNYCHHDKEGNLDTYIATEVPAGTEAWNEEKRKSAAKVGIELKKEKDTDDPSRRIDIFIKGSGFTCTIENKTFSGEHNEQLAIYRADVMEKFKDCGDRNFFIYLRINKPEEFGFSDEEYRKWLAKKSSKKQDNPENTEEPSKKPKYIINPYNGYTFVSYEIVRDILNKLLEKDRKNDADRTVDEIKEREDVRKFIEQYLVGVNRNYDKLEESVEKLCYDILKDTALAEVIMGYEDEKLTPKLKAGKDMFHDYTIYLQKEENDKFIKRQLENIMNKTYHGIIDYHDGRKSKSDPWANTLRLSGLKDAKNVQLSESGTAEVQTSESENKTDAKRKRKSNKDVLKVQKYLNQIDYPAKLGIFSIFFRYGSGETEFLSYLCDEKFLNGFGERIEQLLKPNQERTDNWEIFLEYQVCDGAAQNDAKKTFKIDIKEWSEAEEIFKKITTYKDDGFCAGKYYRDPENYYKDPKRKIKTHSVPLVIGNEVNDDKSLPLAMVKDVFGVQEHAFLQNIIKEYFDNEANSSMNFRWNLCLSYNFYPKPIIEQKDRDEIESSIGEQFYKRTKEGLELFGLDDPFMEEVFKPLKQPAHT